MPDTTIKKVEADFSPKGEMGQRYLVAGKRVSMRLWIDEPGGKLKAPTAREYETVVIRQKRIHQPLVLWCRDKDIWCWE